MSDIEAALVKQVRDAGLIAFNKGVRQIQAEWDASPDVPGRAGSVPVGELPGGGNLRYSLIFFAKSVVTDQLKVTVQNNAQGHNGFEYPSFINRVARIQPTKAKYLHFQLGNGEWVRSSGFDNRWQGWWDSWWGLDVGVEGGQRWADAIIENLELV